MELRNTQPVSSEDARIEAAEDAPWSTARKLGFRFVFSYLFLYIFPLSGTFGWLWGPKFKISELYENLWHKSVPWFGAHVLHLSYPIVIFPEVNGGSDTTYEYVKVLCFALIAAFAVIVWSVIDRKRTEYCRLNQWLRLYLRLVVACAMFSYGSSKVIPVQMPHPSLSTLMQPFGDLTAYRLSWSFIGVSSAYEIFAGIVEVLGGVLLLIPSAAMLGALVTLGAMTNVFMLNMCYGIPVKFWALHLILFCLFLLLPDLRRLTNLFLLNRVAKPERNRPLFRRPALNYLVWGILWAMGLYVIVLTFSSTRALHEQLVRVPLTSPLYGIWKVDEFLADGEVRPPVLTDSVRWQRVIFTASDAMTIQEMNGSFSTYAAVLDAQKNILSLKRIQAENTSSPWWTEFGPGMYRPPPEQLHGFTDLSYRRPQPEAMIVEGLINGHRLHVSLKKEDRKFVLNTLGFRWINDEYDFFNEHVDEINRAR